MCFEKKTYSNCPAISVRDNTMFYFHDRWKMAVNYDFEMGNNREKK